MLRLFIALAAACAGLYALIDRANDNTGAVVPPFRSPMATVVRSIVTVAQFVERFFVPTDLRGHYRYHLTVGLC